MRLDFFAPFVGLHDYLGVSSVEYVFVYRTLARVCYRPCHCEKSVLHFVGCRPTMKILSPSEFPVHWYSCKNNFFKKISLLFSYDLRRKCRIVNSQLSQKLSFHCSPLHDAYAYGTGRHEIYILICKVSFACIYVGCLKSWLCFSLVIQKKSYFTVLKEVQNKGFRVVIVCSASVNHLSVPCMN